MEPQMSLRTRLLVAATLFVAFSASPLRAHDEFRFVGSIVKMDTAKNIVSLKYKEFDGKEDVVDVKLTAKTKISRDTKPVPKSQLRAGIAVVVDALGCDDDYEAVAIKIVPAVK
jgi:hypothetical protein